MLRRTTGSGHLLSIDLGATNTVAVLRDRDGRTSPLLRLPSCVFADETNLYAGGEAEARAADAPERFEPAPRQRVTEPAVRLGERECSPSELLTAVLGAVVTAATEAVGHLPPTVLTHPATWGPAEEAVLRDAAGRAGIADALLVPEPVAAASTVNAANVLVVDVGARAFDVAVVREGIIAGLGGDRAVGGRRVDAAIAAHLAGTSGALGASRPEVWAVIDRPQNVEQRRAQRAFWDEVRRAKESLSHEDAAPVLVPGLDEPLALDRANLDRLAGPLVEAVAEAARKVVGDAGLQLSELDAVLLTGGSARLEVLAPTVRDALSLQPRLPDDPELVAASGALVRLEATVPAPPARRVIPVPAVGSGKSPYLWPAAAGLLVLLALLTVALLLG